MCLVVVCLERADLLAFVCGVQLGVCHFPIGILGQVWYLIVSIPDLCTLSYFDCVNADDSNVTFETSAHLRSKHHAFYATFGKGGQNPFLTKYIQRVFHFIY